MGCMCMCVCSMFLCDVYMCGVCGMWCGGWVVCGVFGMWCVYIHYLGCSKMELCGFELHYCVGYLKIFFLSIVCVD